jgi:hypothetical protein
MVLFVMVALLAAACGGSSSEDSADRTDEPTTTPVAGNVGDDDGGAEAPSGEGSGPSTATVTIGDETYDFSSEGAIVAQCKTNLFGIMSVILPMADGGDGGIQIIALLPGTDPAVVEQVDAVHVSVGDIDWVADPEDQRVANNPDLQGDSQVDSVEFDGRTVRGTATFVGSQSVFNADSDMATGTFEATCGEERLA